MNNHYCRVQLGLGITSSYSCHASFVQGKDTVNVWMLMKGTEKMRLAGPRIIEYILCTRRRELLDHDLRRISRDWSHLHRAPPKLYGFWTDSIMALSFVVILPWPIISFAAALLIHQSSMTHFDGNWSAIAIGTGSC